MKNIFKKTIKYDDSSPNEWWLIAMREMINENGKEKMKQKLIKEKEKEKEFQYNI